jgi:hypothetical protein
MKYTRTKEQEIRLNNNKNMQTKIKTNDDGTKNRGNGKA